jgi:hypothetical protein
VAAAGHPDRGQSLGHSANPGARRRGYACRHPLSPAGRQGLRLHAQTATIENGFVHLPQAAPWLAEYLHELAVFPHGRYDDQVDSTAQFLDWFKLSGREDGIYTYYRLRAAELRRKKGTAPA